MKNRISRFVLFLLIACSAFAQQRDPAAYERILFPIAFQGVVDGAFGTQWQSEILVFNAAAKTLELFPYCVSEVPPAPCRLDQTLAPGAWTRDELRSSESLPSLGAFLYVTREIADDVHFTSLLHDMARTDDNAGTEIPVAREKDFRSRIVLPRVPLRGNFRVALRIYGESQAPSQARVRMYRLDRLDPFVDTTVTLQGLVTALPVDFPTHPAFFHIFELVKTYPVLEAAASVRIEIEALPGQQKVWAFASVTNDATQLVTTVSPQ
jgi:hypothetical protein